MKTVVYRLQASGGCSWHMSLDIRADRDHWIRQYGRMFKMDVLEPSLSFGQASMLCEALNQAGPKVKPLDVLRQTGSRLRIPADRVRSCRLWEWSPSNEETGAGPFQTAEELAFQLNLLSASIQGRYLFMEEWDALSAYEGWGWAEPERKYMLQSAWLTGKIELDCGIRMMEPPKRRLLPSMARSAKPHCSRCGNEDERRIRWSDCPSCGGPCPYCEECLTMGRSRFCTPLIRAGGGTSELRKQTSEEDFITEPYTEPWGLSDLQTEAAGQALRFLKANEFHPRKGLSTGEKPRFLIWAVTGAGKTEMIFPMVRYTLDQGGKVAITTPRRDVVLELKPRIERAFAGVKVVTLYGGSEQRWERGDITIATTHQLMRFREAFDLVIVDEIDAFPYHNNPLLQYAVSQTCTPQGAYILLSATPPEKLQREARRGRLVHARVPARYHRHPLPVPRFIKTEPLLQIFKKRQLPSDLEQRLGASLERGAQLFIFVPKIAMVLPAVQLLRAMFPNVSVEGTSSKDDERADKVTQFRERQIRMLVTTTILERGVTIPKSDVFIWDADAPIFDAAALVQMAGRAGRSAQDPNGNVYFSAKEKTSAQAGAVRQIKEMNRIALKKGYLNRVNGGDKP